MHTGGAGNHYKKVVTFSQCFMRSIDRWSHDRCMNGCAPYRVVWRRRRRGFRCAPARQEQAGAAASVRRCATDGGLSTLHPENAVLPSADECGGIVIGLRGVVTPVKAGNRPCAVAHEVVNVNPFRRAGLAVRCFHVLLRHSCSFLFIDATYCIACMAGSMSSAALRRFFQDASRASFVISESTSAPETGRLNR